MTVNETVWTVGAELVNKVEDDPAINLHHGVLRRFEMDRGEVSTFVQPLQIALSFRPNRRTDRIAFGSWPGAIAKTVEVGSSCFLINAGNKSTGRGHPPK